MIDSLPIAVCDHRRIRRSKIYSKEAFRGYQASKNKKNSKRALPPSLPFVQSYHRKRVETAGCLIEQLLPKSIRTVTSQGFELKVALFVITSSLKGYLNL